MSIDVKYNRLMRARFRRIHLSKIEAGSEKSSVRNRLVSLAMWIFTWFKYAI